MKFLPIILLIALVLLLWPQAALAAPTLVPCGRSDQQPPRDEFGRLKADVNLANYPHAQCDFQDLVILIVRLINYLIAVSTLVAIYFVLLSGWNLIAAVGNAEKIKTAKAGISNAVVGFGMVVLAFVFVNLLVNGIFGSPDPTQHRSWWDVRCVFDITNSNTEGCPGS